MTLICVCLYLLHYSKPKSEMTQEELNKREEEEFLTGPLSILAQSVKNNTQVRTKRLWSESSTCQVRCQVVTGRGLSTSRQGCEAGLECLDL
jgi:hypothetical protein